MAGMMFWNPVHIQQHVDEMSPGQRRELAGTAYDALESALCSGRRLSQNEREKAVVAIEYLSRIEATEQRKGWLYRMIRRFHLSQVYLR